MNKAELIKAIKAKKSYLCVGLDTDMEKLPKHLPRTIETVVAFNKAIINSTKDFCVSYKINTAFYECHGSKGWDAMAESLEAIPSTHFTIADAKRGDIGNTSSYYAKTFFETLNFDAITVAPYMGEDSVRPFLEYENKTTIVLGLTSNKGSNDFQQLLVDEGDDTSMIPNIIKGTRKQALYEKVLEKVASWGTTDNLMFVIGATQAFELENIRGILPEHFFLVPGVGFQGGSLADVSRYGLNKDIGLLVNASRAIIYAGGGEDFAEEAAIIAQQYQTEMATYLD